MKRKLLLFLMSVLVSGVMAQAPQKINYQAVARNSSGEILKEQTLTVRIGILQNDLVIWQEDHAVITNNLGLFTLQIGGPEATNGSGPAGSFGNIVWGTGNYMIDLSVDSGGGLEPLGKSELLSVPFALHAASGIEGPQGPEGP
ncbi:MAG: hypothetical protein WD052_10915, partial [Bacteroidales bacterium]